MMQRRSMSRSATHARFPRQFASMARWHSHSPPRTPPGRSAVSKAALPRLSLRSTDSRSAATALPVALRTPTACSHRAAGRCRSLSDTV
jgi:hypothetical protein